MDDRLRPLYDAIDITTGFNDRLRIGDAAILWGGRPTDPEYLLSEQDFTTWNPHQFDSYVPPWGLEFRIQVAIVSSYRDVANKLPKNVKDVCGDLRIGTSS